MPEGELLDISGDCFGNRILGDRIKVNQQRSQRPDKGMIRFNSKKFLDFEAVVGSEAQQLFWFQTIRDRLKCLPRILSNAEAEASITHSADGVSKSDTWCAAATVIQQFRTHSVHRHFESVGWHIPATSFPLLMA